MSYPHRCDCPYHGNQYVPTQCVYCARATVTFADLSDPVYDGPSAKEILEILKKRRLPEEALRNPPLNTEADE